MKGKLGEKVLSPGEKRFTGSSRKTMAPDEVSADDLWAMQLPPGEEGRLRRSNGHGPSRSQPWTGWGWIDARGLKRRVGGFF